MLPWTLKYMPRRASDIAGQDTPLQKLRAYITSYRSQKKKAALVYGPVGCGKTSSVYALADELGLELLEVNASDFRDKESMSKILGPAIQQVSLFSKGKLILVDEVDGISAQEDRGGLSEILALIDHSTFPVILVANDPWDSKFSALRSKAEMIEFNTLAYTSVRSVLKKICDAESVKYDDSSISALARQAGGDARAAITDLQVISSMSGSVDKDGVSSISERQKVDSMIDALIKILKTTSPEVALPAFDNVDEDTDGLFLWIDENLSREYARPEDLARAYDAMSMADVFRGRIRRREHWRFLVYIKDLLTAGIALAKKEKYPGFNKYTRTTRIFRIWQANMKNSRRKAVAEKLARHSHCSTRQAFKEIPLFKIICKSGKEKADAIIEELGLEKEEIEYMLS